MLEHLHLKELQEKGISGNIIKDNPTNKIKKKLLIATDSFLPRWDGITRFLTEIIPRLKDNYEITVIAPEFPGEIYIAKIEVENRESYKFYMLNFCPFKFTWEFRCNYCNFIIILKPWYDFCQKPCDAVPSRQKAVCCDKQFFLYFICGVIFYNVATNSLLLQFFKM